MVSINPEIIKIAEESLKSKAFGGVSKESALEAIKKAADGVKKIADDTIGAVQKELQQYKGKTAQEMAELTSQKDKFQALAQKEAQRADKAEGIITDLKEKAAKYTKTKEGKPKRLANGNTETVKVNKNGARMTTERTPEDKVVQITVENLDGDIRKTTLDPATGKPVKTFTNINGDKTIEYTNKGAKVKNVNVKKVKPQKPKVVSETILKEDYNFQTIQKSYSDGSYDLVEYSKKHQKPLIEKKFNAQNKQVSQIEHEFDSKNNESIVTVNYNPETGIKTDMTQEYLGQKTKYIYNESGNSTRKEEKTAQGLKRIISAKTDRYGNVDVSNPSMKYKYPKNSPIKESNIEYTGQYYAEKETLTMRDGSTVTMKINNNYDPYNVTIQKPGEAPKVLESHEAEDYLQKIGKVGYRQDEKYFNNYLCS